VARDITRTQLLKNQLIRSERLAATGQLAASIAHEINSPLQGIAALLNVLRSTYEGDDYLQRKLDLIKSAFNSIRDTVRNLIDLHRPGKEKKQQIDVNQVVENTMALVKSLLKKHMISADLALRQHPVLTVPSGANHELSTARWRPSSACRRTAYTRSEALTHTSRDRI
jgi:C4-dicarboxylate-specific signal transduction histidine kinase